MQRLIGDGNKMIAEFIGKKVVCDCDVNYEIDNELFDLSQLRYHLSWEWLMPVVEKIESMGYQFKICRKRVEVFKDGDHSSIPVMFSKFESKIESVWNGVVESIKWHDNNGR